VQHFDSRMLKETFNFFQSYCSKGTLHISHYQGRINTKLGLKL